MKLTEAYRFPHPVLSETSGDYVDDAIDLDLKVDEQPQNGELTLFYDFKVNSPTVSQELENETAVAFLSVVCLDTAYNEFHEISRGTGKVKIEAGLVYSRVSVRAIVARLEEGTLDASGLQADYETSKFAVDAGGVLAWTIPLRFSVGMDKLVPMDSIFKLSRDDSLNEDTIGVSYEGDYISIRAPEQLLTTITALRSTSAGRPVVLTSIYMPAIMTVLDGINASADYQDRRWHRVISAKAESLGIELENGESLSAVQVLLKGPLGRLKIFMEKV